MSRSFEREPGRAEGRKRCGECGAELSGPGTVCATCAPTADGTIGDALGTTQAPTVVDGQTSTAPAGYKEIAHYRLIRELGAGGMGTVFEAHDSRMDRRVALKVMSRHQAPSEKAEKRFEHEAWIAGRLDHPRLVKVFERGTWEELSYYSMELVPGGSLADVIGRLKRGGRDDRLGLAFGSADYVRWAVTKVIEAARGLQYAHGSGVVHRDIKPMNLLLSDETYEVKIADFGLAINQDATRLTTAGKVLGTLAYMAPEQILGKQEVDGRADVYALGVTLFELLTLELPYTGKTQQMYMNAVLTAEARRPRKLNERVGRDLEIVIHKSLEKQPRDRYATVAEMADDLEAVLQHRPIRARPPNAGERLLKWARRRPFRAALVAVLVVGTPLVAFLGNRALEQSRLARQQRIEQLEAETRWLLQHERRGEVIESTSKILRIDPGHLHALETRSASRVVLSERADDPEEKRRLQSDALADAERIVALEPEAAWAHKLMAWVLREVGREAEADEAERRAERFRPSRPTDTDLYLEGRLALQSGDYATAVEVLSQAIVLRPGWPALPFDRAQAHEGLGHVAEAIQDYRVALALNPEDHYTLLNLGRLLTASGEVDEGARYTRRARELAPDNAIVLEESANLALVLGRSAAASGDEAAAELFREAEGHARAALALDPGGIWSRLNLGASLMEQNRLLDAPDPARIDEAVGHYREAIRRLESLPGREGEGEIAAALVNSCDARIQAGQLDRALESCREVTEHLPEEPVGFYNLAGVLALLGRDEEALAALERDLELGDTDWRYLESDEWFASLREDPRYLDLLERMKRLSE